MSESKERGQLSYPKGLPRDSLLTAQALIFHGRVSWAHLSCLLSSWGLARWQRATELLSSILLQSVQHVHAAVCGQIPMFSSSQPSNLIGVNLLLSPETCVSLTGQGWLRWFLVNTVRAEENKIWGTLVEAKGTQNWTLGALLTLAAVPKSACLGQLFSPHPEGGSVN